jgi:hypothetical protein
MDHQKTHLQLVANNETPAELDSVAAAIRPLPEDVAPSEEFLGELRMRLLKLEPRRRSNGNSQRAA